VVFAGLAILRGDFRGVLTLSESTRPAKSVVFAGVLILRGDFRGVLALSESARPDSFRTSLCACPLAVHVFAKRRIPRCDLCCQNASHEDRSSVRRHQ
jgi:hypothetical protein